MSFQSEEFVSPLDSLVFDTYLDTTQSDREAAEELALWSNAQFTFDVQPGQSVENHHDQEKDAVTYEKLRHYLDHELPALSPSASTQLQQQQQPLPQQQQQPQTQPPPLSQTKRPPARMLLPKPMDPAQLASLPPPPQISAAASTSKPSRKRPANRNKTEDQLAAEEDKRRRNTAASARFRIKKKMREQAMEQTVRDMTAKSEMLQKRVQELELEIKWLRGLLLEKNSHN